MNEKKIVIVFIEQENKIYLLLICIHVNALLFFKVIK